MNRFYAAIFTTGTFRVLREANMFTLGERRYSLLHRKLLLYLEHFRASQDTSQSLSSNRRMLKTVVKILEFYSWAVILNDIELDGFPHNSTDLFPTAPSIGLLSVWQLKNFFDIFLFCHSLALRSRVCFPPPAAGVFWSPPWKTIRKPSVRTLEEVPNGQSWYPNSSSSSSSPRISAWPCVWAGMSRGAPSMLEANIYNISNAML